MDMKQKEEQRRVNLLALSECEVQKLSHVEQYEIMRWRREMLALDWVAKQQAIAAEGRRLEEEKERRTNEKKEPKNDSSLKKIKFGE